MQAKNSKNILQSSSKRNTIKIVVNHAEIERRREALGLTMAEAAERAGFPDRQRWNIIEKGHRRDPSASTLAAVARALGCRMEDLMEEATGK